MAWVLFMHLQRQFQYWPLGILKAGEKTSDLIYPPLFLPQSHG